MFQVISECWFQKYEDSLQFFFANLLPAKVLRKKGYIAFEEILLFAMEVKQKVELSIYHSNNFHHKQKLLRDFLLIQESLLFYFQRRRSVSFIIFPIYRIEIYPKHFKTM